MENDLIERIVDWVVQAQDNTEHRFGGFSYGNDYVVRDHVMERHHDKSVEIFRAPYDLCDHEDVLRRVKRRHVIEDLRECLRNRPEQLLNLVTEIKRA